MKRFLIGAIFAVSFLSATSSTAAPVNVTLVRWPYT